MCTATTAFTTARDDEGAQRHKNEYVFQNDDSTRSPSCRAVASCVMTQQLRIAKATMSRDIFLGNGNTGLFIENGSCNTVTVIYQGDLSTLAYILFLYLLSLWRLTPLEMTEEG